MDEEKVKELVRMNENIKVMDAAYGMAIEDPEVRRQYLYELMLRQGIAEDLAEARKDGHDEGEAIGIAKGEATGITIGDRKKSELVAIRMLKRGTDTLEDISMFTDLTKEEILELHKRLQSSGETTV